MNQYQIPFFIGSAHKRPFNLNKPTTASRFCIVYQPFRVEMAFEDELQIMLSKVLFKLNFPEVRFFFGMLTFDNEHSPDLSAITMAFLFDFGKAINLQDLSLSLSFRGMHPQMYRSKKSESSCVAKDRIDDLLSGRIKGSYLSSFDYPADSLFSCKSRFVVSEDMLNGSKTSS
jgi:hypothetical protein